MWPNSRFLHLNQRSKDATNLLNVVVGQGAAILELLAGENQALLVGGNALLVLNLRLDIVDSIGGLHLKGDSLARQGLHEAVSKSVFPISFRRRSRWLIGRRSAIACPEPVGGGKVRVRGNSHLHWKKR